ncbi:MAG: antitoxin [Pseudonocardia sp.]|nr:antitoxin [Pseudonocardia sp.]
MNRDELLRQGKDIAEKLRAEASSQAAAHEQQIKDALDKVVGFVNNKTGGKYADQVSKYVAFVEQGLSKLAEGARPTQTKTPPPANTTEPPDVAPPSSNGAATPPTH